MWMEKQEYRQRNGGRKISLYSYNDAHEISSFYVNKKNLNKKYF